MAQGEETFRLQATPDQKLVGNFALAVESHTYRARAFLAKIVREGLGGRRRVALTDRLASQSGNQVDAGAEILARKHVSSACCGAHWSASAGYI